MPGGNLLGPDIRAEVTLHVLGGGENKALVSKFEDSAEQKVSQQVIQGLINTAIGIAKERRISINWPGVASLHPPYQEHEQAFQPPSAAPPP